MPDEMSAKLTTRKLPLGKAVDVQDSDKSSDPVATGFHIEDQVDKRDHEFLDTKPL